MYEASFLWSFILKSNNLRNVRETVADDASPWDFSFTTSIRDLYIYTQESPKDMRERFHCFRWLYYLFFFFEIFISWDQSEKCREFWTKKKNLEREMILFVHFLSLDFFFLLFLNQLKWIFFSEFISKKRLQGCWWMRSHYCFPCLSFT